ncbi:hypothetical protein RN50_01044 [Microbacterium foliorum]|uniref:Uncharacterized protein n=2 Tax=Microbacterium foliorum TaxID=104336 RepID=A0A0F0KTB4_9MICO|nr:hypothetical protein RN50_01044 [Microbacterium foliorum]
MEKVTSEVDFDFSVEPDNAAPVHIIETLDAEMGGWTAARCM